VLCLDLNRYWMYSVERQSDYLNDKEGCSVSVIQTRSMHFLGEKRNTYTNDPGFQMELQYIYEKMVLKAIINF
jgi:hypothetical protein